MTEMRGWIESTERWEGGGPEGGQVVVNFFCFFDLK